MKLPISLLAITLAVTPSIAASWGFDDGSLTVQAKKGSSKTTLKEKILENKALKSPLAIGPQESLKILLTTKEGGKNTRAHQTFLQLRDQASELDTSFAFEVKENGKAKLELATKDVPLELLSAKTPVHASIVIASFGSSKPYKADAFEITFEHDPTQAPAKKPVRYGKLPQIHHTFKTDPKSPPKIITIFFTAVVVLAVPALVIIWTSLGANLKHLPQAISDAPLPHTLFFTSILALEGVFFLYYTHWKLFQVLPVALGIGLVSFLSGSRALREVQQRRLTRSR